MAKVTCIVISPIKIEIDGKLTNCPVNKIIFIEEELFDELEVFGAVSEVDAGAIFSPVRQEEMDAATAAEFAEFLALKKEGGIDNAKGVTSKESGTEKTESIDSK